MHPIERLRYVARSSATDHVDLVRETAAALAALGFDAAGLVTACRRILDKHPRCGPLWWLAARVLMAPEPRDEAWRVVAEMEADPTASELVAVIPDDATVCVLGWPELVGQALPRRGDLQVLVVDRAGEGYSFVQRLVRSDVDAIEVAAAGLGAAAAASQVILVEATAVGPDEFLGVAGSRAAAAVGHHAGVPVWLVSGAGRLLPERMWGALRQRIEGDRDSWEADDEVVPLDLVDGVVGARGFEAVADYLLKVDCPSAPELLRAPR